MLTFDDASHTYRWHGDRVPSVTQILKPISPDFRRVPSETLERARALGVAVDHTITLFELDDLDEESLDPQLAAYLDAWKKLKAFANIEVISVQGRVYHSVYKYAGTFDVLAKVGGFDSVLDIKRTFAIPASVGPQTAAYAEAISVMRRGEKVRSRYAVHLKPKEDGSVVGKLEPLSRASDMNVFLSCNSIWRFNHEHGNH